MNELPRVLIVVEDPGAANFVADLPQGLSETGMQVQVLSGPTAESQLRALNVEFSRLQNDAKASDVVDATNPDLIIVGTSENRDAIGLSLIDFARGTNIPIAAVVDGPANAENRFRGNGAVSNRYAPDQIYVADGFTRSAYIGAGFEADKIIAVGHPHFDRVCDAREALEHKDRSELRHKYYSGVPTDQPVILFLAEISDGLVSSDFCANDEYTLGGRGTSRLRTDIVLEELLGGVRCSPRCPVVFVRLHPKNTTDEFQAYTSEVQGFLAGGNALESVFAADLVVGMTTSLLTESVLLGRPTISILPRQIEKDWNLATQANWVRCLTRRDEVKSFFETAWNQADVLQVAGVSASPRIERSVLIPEIISFFKKCRKRLP